MSNFRALIFDAAKQLGARFRNSDDVAVMDKAIDEFEHKNGYVVPPPPPPSGIPDDYWPLLAQIESGGRPYIKARTSSASGLYQFIRKTWLGEGGQWGDDMSLAFGGLQPSIEEQLERAKSFTEKNAAYLRAQGVPINKASLYAAHFLGPVTAAKVIAADITESAEALAGPDATNANQSILKGKTVAQFLSWLHTKTGDWAR
jgi:hypothetical protein